MCLNKKDTKPAAELKDGRGTQGCSQGQRRDRNRGALRWPERQMVLEDTKVLGRGFEQSTDVVRETPTDWRQERWRRGQKDRSEEEEMS